MYIRKVSIGLCVHTTTLKLTCDIPGQAKLPQIKDNLLKYGGIKKYLIRINECFLIYIYHIFLNLARAGRIFPNFLIKEFINCCHVTY